MFSSIAFAKDQPIVNDLQLNGLIAAFGDFDSDRFTDVFVISDQGKALRLLKSREKRPELGVWPNFVCIFDETDEIITGVQPADFNGDASMDVLVISKKLSHLMKNKFNVRVSFGNRIKLDCDSLKTPLIEDALSEPLLLDFNGDMIADFIVETEECPRQLWLYSTLTKKFRKECPPSLQPPDASNRKMQFPNSNAFVNLKNCDQNNLDFATDIFITGEKNMEYWIDSGGFNPDNVVNIPYPTANTIGQSTFIDLNIDGCVDHIIPVCEKMSAFESLLHPSYCVPHILLFDEKQHSWVKISDFGQLDNDTKRYFEPITTRYGFEIPFALRAGDIDGDGFVDLVTVMKSLSDYKFRAVLLKNEPDNSVVGGRKFVVTWTSEEYIEDEVELVSFLDVQENGKLDLIMTTRSEHTQYNIQWIRNTFMESTCFLKVLVTTSLPISNDKIAYGTNQAGPFICYEIYDINGHLLRGCATQLSQSNHFALQMPYSIFGIGETPNFVESVSASIPSGEISPVRKARWTQIVPDAQVVLIPFPPNDTAYWTSKLFYTPSSMVFSTLATLAVLCVILIVIIIILHRKEILEDLSEHEEYKRHWPESR